MERWLFNFLLLVGKELRTALKDIVLLALIVFSFTAGVYSAARGVKLEVVNASVGVIDEDHSQLSYRLRQAIRAPQFSPPVSVERKDAAAAVEKGLFTFIVEIPPRFQADVQAFRRPTVQILADTTAMAQAGLGAGYLNEILLRETLEFLGPVPGGIGSPPITIVPGFNHNENADSAWFGALMQIVTIMTVLAIILVGAAVMRERERGTLEHLMVMPVRPSEIAVAKIVANGMLILIAALLALWFVAHLWIGVPLSGSLPLYALCAAIFLFAITSLGMWLSTLARNMPQFALLALPVYALTYLLSGAATPVESMPAALRSLVQFLPTTQFVVVTQSILMRGAGIGAVRIPLAVIAISGFLFFGMAIARFRLMLARQQ